MDRSFYRFALSFRGGTIDDLKSTFAEYMFKDSSFPKEEKDFRPIIALYRRKGGCKNAIRHFRRVISVI